MFGGILLFNEDRQCNVKDILINFAQMKHLEHFKSLGIIKRRKEDTINELINYVRDNNSIYEEFKIWLSKLTMDGYNSYYIFNYKNLDRKSSEKILSTLIVKDITLINKENITKTELIYLDCGIDTNRVCMRFVSPSEKLNKINQNGIQMNQIEKSLYFTTVYIDFTLEQIIVSLHPISEVISVNGIEIPGRDYAKVAKGVLNDILSSIINFQIENCDMWIYDSLVKFADEATSHNNPIVSQKCASFSEKIDIIINNLLSEAGVKNQSNIQYMKEEVSILFENVMIEEHGIIECDDEYEVFAQDGDQVNSYVKVGTKTSSLKGGRTAAIAKSTRNNSDINLLGVKKKFGERIYRFLISVESKNYYVIRTDTSIFVKEEVIYDVIRKVRSYKEIS